MNTFDKIIELQRDLLNAQLEVISKYQQKTSSKIKSKSMSKLSIVEDILKLSGKSLHISQIIEIAKNKYNITLERDSIVSAITKKIRNNKQFIRVAPNTFSVKNNNTDQNE
jgi:hypothetical protein